jgi:hypothetical protein
MNMQHVQHSHRTGRNTCAGARPSVLRDMVQTPRSAAHEAPSARRYLLHKSFGRRITHERTLKARSRGNISILAADVPSLSSRGVVITGGSKGLGYAMADEFLSRGDRVVICARNPSRLQAAVASLHAKFPAPGSVQGIKCDVSSPEDVSKLGEFAKQTLGDVHIWINNAGQVTSKQLLADVPPEEILSAVGSNVVGSLLGCR